MTKQEQFFFDHAGFSYDPKTETKRQGRKRCARELAAAETYAAQQGWSYEWETDVDGCIGCDCGSEDCACSTGDDHETLVCYLFDGETQLGSLGGICGATREYRRVVEAELALEAMHADLAIAR